MIRKLEAVDTVETVKLAIASTTQELEQAQKLQMLQGKDSTGGQIGRYKNQDYAEMKFGLNPLAGKGNMDFRLTGDFYKRISTTLGSNAVSISSSDSKTERLLNINPDVFGLNKESISEYSVHHLGPVATRLIKKQIHGV